MVRRANTRSPIPGAVRVSRRSGNKNDSGRRRLAAPGHRTGVDLAVDIRIDDLDHAHLGELRRGANPPARAALDRALVDEVLKQGPQRTAIGGPDVEGAPDLALVDAAAPLADKA